MENHELVPESERSRAASKFQDSVPGPVSKMKWCGGARCGVDCGGAAPEDPRHLLVAERLNLLGAPHWLGRLAGEKGTHNVSRLGGGCVRARSGGGNGFYGRPLSHHGPFTNVDGRSSQGNTRDHGAR